MSWLLSFDCIKIALSNLHSMFHLLLQVIELGGTPTIGDCAMILRAAIKAPVPSAFLKILQTTHSLGYVFGRYVYFSWDKRFEFYLQYQGMSVNMTWKVKLRIFNNISVSEVYFLLFIFCSLNSYGIWGWKIWTSDFLVDDICLKLVELYSSWHLLVSFKVTIF